MSVDFSDRRRQFKALHERSGAFVIPNPWDIGSARILASMGFEALATTSAGMAFALGVPEGTITKEQTLDHCTAIVNATSLPVSADLEQGFGESPQDVARCIEQAAQTGLAGASIEDYTGQKQHPIYDFELSVERIAAAVEASRNVSADFVLTARSENYCWGINDLDDTIKRLQAFERVGADVLYAPGLRSLEDISVVCTSLDKPVNVVMGMAGATFGVTELEAAGVKRISVGSALARAAYGEFVRAAVEMQVDGRFTFSDKAIGFSELDAFLSSYKQNTTQPEPDVLLKL